MPSRPAGAGTSAPPASGGDQPRWGGGDKAATMGPMSSDLIQFADQPPSAAAARVAVRTGDTPAAERRRQRQAPPDVLCTTPESLAVLLSQPALQGLFAGLRWVVVDEVHGLAGNKRGADLALSLERLTALAA